MLITGTSSGIGAELSYIFAEKGHDLILVGRNEDQLEAVKKNVKDKYGKTVHAITTDLSLSGSAQKLYDKVTKEGLQVDVLVNNAGLGAEGDSLEQPLDLVERMNCTSLVQLTQLFGGDMIKRGSGWMLQVPSVGGRFFSSLHALTFKTCSHYRRVDVESRPKPLPRHQALRTCLFRCAVCGIAGIPRNYQRSAHAGSDTHNS